MTEEYETFDVVVAGSGGGGMMAAVYAASRGLKVLVVEKDDVVGGTSALSGGGVWVPCNRIMAAAGVEDSPEKAREYVANVLGNLIRPDMVEAYLANGPEMISFLEDSTEVKFHISAWVTDYYSDIGGAVEFGRNLFAKPFDGGRLGQHLAKLRRPFHQFQLFGDMNIDSMEVVHFLHALRSPDHLIKALRLFGRHVGEKFVFGRGVRLALGNALMGAFFKTALDHGVTIWTGAAAEALTEVNGRVTGLEISREGRRIVVQARRGVVLATGGIGHAKALRERFLPDPDHISLTVETNEGDGVELGLKAGGRIGDPLYQNFLGQPVSEVRLKGRPPQKILHYGFERSKPGVICVNEKGQRFLNDAGPYNDFTRDMAAAGVERAYFICDHHHLRKYGFGPLRMGPAWLRRVKPLIDIGYLHRAPTLAALALKVGIDPAGLESCVARYNQFAAEGADPDFGRGDTLHDRRSGDGENKPHPNLAPLVKAPFYAIRIFEGDVGTWVGLKTDPQARVVREDDSPIPGLYACGLDAHSVFSGQYPSGGSSLGPAMIFGYIAAKHMLGESAP